MRSFRRIHSLVALLVVVSFFALFTHSCVHAPGVIPISQIPVDTSICFERDILPVFQSNCTQSGCHDAGSHESGYVFDSYANIVKKGIIPGNPMASKVYTCIAWLNGSQYMPAVGPQLPAETIALVKRWITAGARDSGGCYVNCDTTNYTFSGAVLPIMQKYCAGCHNGSARSDYTTYETIKNGVLNGDILPAVRHDVGYPIMPENAAKLLDCQITQLEKWAAAGAPNN